MVPAAGLRRMAGVHKIIYIMMSSDESLSMPYLYSELGCGDSRVAVVKNSLLFIWRYGA